MIKSNVANSTDMPNKAILIGVENMALSKKPTTGMKDILPQEMRIRDYVISVIQDTYAQFGFTHIETPCVENINVTLIELSVSTSLRSVSSPYGTDLKSLKRCRKRSLIIGIESYKRNRQVIS